MFKKLLLATMLFTSISSFAGQDGNGGFGINCNGQLEILDLYEAKARYHYNVDLGPLNASVEQKVQLMLKRLERFNVHAAQRYREQYKNLWQMAAILNGQKIIKNEDTLVGSNISYDLDIGTALVPENCKLIPLARNVEGGSLAKNIYFIGKYWNQLNNNTKAALILHELIYFDSISGRLQDSGLGFTVRDSSGVRKIIGILSSAESEKLKFPELLKEYMEECRGDTSTCLHSNVFHAEINGFPYSYITLDPDLFKMSSDGSYVKLVTGESISLQRKRQFLGKKVSIMMTNNTTEFFDKNTPNVFLLSVGNDSDEFIHYSFTNGTLTFAAKSKTTRYYSYPPTRVILWQPEKIRQVTNMQNAEINLPLFGKQKANIVSFDEKGNVVIFTTGQDAYDVNTPMIFEQFKKYKDLSVRYYYDENSAIKEIYINRIVLKNDNPYFKIPKHGYVAFDKAILYPNLKIKCAQVEDPYNIKINGHWKEALAGQTVELDSNGKPIGLDCKIPNPDLD